MILEIAIIGVVCLGVASAICFAITEAAKIKAQSNVRYTIVVQIVTDETGKIHEQKETGT